MSGYKKSISREAESLGSKAEQSVKNSDNSFRIMFLSIKTLNISLRFRESGEISVCMGQVQFWMPLDASDLQALCITNRHDSVMENTP